MYLTAAAPGLPQHAPSGSTIFRCFREGTNPPWPPLPGRVRCVHCSIAKKPRHRRWRHECRRSPTGTMPLSRSVCGPSRGDAPAQRKPAAADRLRSAARSAAGPIQWISRQIHFLSFHIAVWVGLNELRQETNSLPTRPPHSVLAPGPPANFGSVSDWMKFRFQFGSRQG